jgi:arsenite methyltransferase
MAATHEKVQDYYGKKLQKTEDLKTTACTTSCGGSFPQVIKKALADCHEEVVSKYYGCGPVFPEAVEGCHVLDLGSGSGRDCFVLSKLVGEKGYVTGVDMTQEQLDLANSHIDYHMRLFGHSKPNVEFRKGFIEDLSTANIEDTSQDIVVSNCVICLCSDKKAVFREACRVLKPGGEMYISDVYNSRQVPEEIVKDEVLWSEGISGALQWEEFLRLACDIGFSPPMLVDVAHLVVQDSKLRNIVGDLRSCSATYRLFKRHPGVNANIEDGLLQVKYKGTITDVPDTFKLAWDIALKAHLPARLPASIVSAILSSRLAPHFDISPASPQAVATTHYKSAQDLLTVNPFNLLDDESCCKHNTAGKSCC